MRFAQQCRRILVENVLHENRDAGQRLHFKQIDRDNLRLGSRRKHRLAPAARCSAKIVDPADAGEQPELFIELDQLVVTERCAERQLQGG